MNKNKVREKAEKLGEMTVSTTALILGSIIAAVTFTVVGIMQVSFMNRRKVPVHGNPVIGVGMYKHGLSGEVVNVVSASATSVYVESADGAFNIPIAVFYREYSRA